MTPPEFNGIRSAPAGRGNGPVLVLRLLLVLMVAGVALWFLLPRRQPGTRIPHPSSVPPLEYEDYTARAGIRFHHDDCAQGIATIVEQLGPGCAIFDADGDGWPDLLFLNGKDLYGRGWKRQDAFYHNNQDGTFSDETVPAGLANSGYGQGVAVGDYDNDGHPDLYLCQYGKNALYHNNGDGTFTDVTARAGVDGMQYHETVHSGATFIDYDRDGRLDLFVCGYVRFRGGPRYCRVPDQPITSNCPPAQYPGTNCILYHNNGDGTFRDVSRSSGILIHGSKALTPTVVDYNDDGWPDLYVGNDGVPAYLLRNNKNGTFTDVATQAGIARTDTGGSMAAMGLDFGDYQNNGRPGLFVADFQDQPDHLFEQVNAGVFLEATTRAGIGTPTLSFLGFGGGFLDYDNDGWLDLFVVNGHVYPEIDRASFGARYRQHAQLFHNRGDGSFLEVTAKAGPAFSLLRSARGAAWGDLWNRGVQDIAVANNSDPPTLMRHTGAPGAHFLSLKLVGARSNRDAIGARVWVTAGGMRQMRDLSLTRSYLSSVDPRLHFGLGHATTVERVEVRWPLGQRQYFTHLPADRWYQIVEGKPAAGPEPIARR